MNLVYGFFPPRIDMTHRHRKNMMKSDAENKLLKTKLQRRFQEEYVLLVT